MDTEEPLLDFLDVIAFIRDDSDFSAEEMIERLRSLFPQYDIQTKSVGITVSARRWAVLLEFHQTPLPPLTMRWLQAQKAGRRFSRQLDQFSRRFEFCKTGDELGEVDEFAAVMTGIARVLTEFQGIVLISPDEERC